MTGEQLLLDVDSRSDEFWRAAAWQALEHLAASDEPFDAWSLVELGVPEPTSSASLGALFYAARRAGLIVKVGYGQSRRPTTRGSLVCLWVGRGGAA